MKSLRRRAIGCHADAGVLHGAGLNSYSSPKCLTVLGLSESNGMLLLSEVGLLSKWQVDTEVELQWNRPFSSILPLAFPIVISIAQKPLDSFIPDPTYL